ncbi:hypothetical protein STCU_00879 [Strigomonas culicis]|nr:hypothetical protein STCU_00879 [Strigomonas culicis]|eukprot:EPY35852.1 hypothetical protein STCU_00879 [Strigomonas culicis]
MMAKAVTTSDSFYSERNAVEGYADRKDRIRQQRKDQKNTLSQWYGMKKANLSATEKRELELLQYRNFVNPEDKHRAPKKTSAAETEFVEFGYFAGTGRNKRKRYKSFADEWIEENPEFEEVVAKRIKHNVKFNKRAKELAAKRAAKMASKSKMKRAPKRKSKSDDSM